MKRHLKRREGWSVAGDWKLKRRRRLEVEASRRLEAEASPAIGSWSISGDWKLKRRDLASPASEASRSGRHRRLIRRDWASPASESSRLGVETTAASWSVVILFESLATASWEYGGDGRRSVAGAKEGEASPVTWTVGIAGLNISEEFLKNTCLVLYWRI